MLTRPVKAKLAEDLQLWVADGLISAKVAELLRPRYAASEFGLVGVIKYVGISGGLLALLGLLGLIGASLGSKLVAALLGAAIGAALLGAGIYLAADVRHRFAFSSHVVMALGAAGLGAGVAGAAISAGVTGEATLLIDGAVVLPVFFFLAYRFRNAFLLVLAVLGLFHWVGSWTQMLGRSTYELNIQEPRLMAVAALLVFAVGLWHERHPERFLRFHRVYQALSLAYLDLSLLILSIEQDHALGWVLALTAAVLAQVVLGARLKNGLVLGFGVTFAAIDLFTRYYETFWDRLGLGLFLLIGGGGLLVIGAVLERILRSLRKPEAA